jgi:hypothetical protein
MLLDLRVSADRAVWHPPHTGGKPGLFQEPRRNPERDGLSAGGRWIRTSSTAVREPRIFRRTQVDHSDIRTAPEGGHQARLRRLAAGVVGSAAACAPLPTPAREPAGAGRVPSCSPSSGRDRVLRTGCFPRQVAFQATMRSITGGGAAISLGLAVNPFILASVSSRMTSC